jgi:hypothetical protein
MAEWANGDLMVNLVAVAVAPDNLAVVVMMVQVKA